VGGARLGDRQNDADVRPGRAPADEARDSVRRGLEATCHPAIRGTTHQLDFAVDALEQPFVVKAKDAEPTKGVVSDPSVD
jgi:hypothetical protein